LLQTFQLTDEDLEKKVKQYSRGMKQKLGIVQAIQEKPDLLIMDEPSEGLDPLNRNVDYLLRFKNEGMTIFFSSHNLAEVEKISDHVGLVKEGKFIALEPIAELKKKMVRRMEIEFIDGQIHTSECHPDSFVFLSCFCSGCSGYRFAGRYICRIFDFFTGNRHTGIYESCRNHIPFLFECRSNLIGNQYISA